MADATARVGPRVMLPVFATLLIVKQVHGKRDVEPPFGFAECPCGRTAR